MTGLGARTVHGPVPLVVGVALLTVGAVSFAAGLFLIQAAQMQADMFRGNAEDRVGLTSATLAWGHGWVWTGIIAAAVGMGLMGFAFWRRRASPDGHGSL
jgi:hypothetical protein